MGAASPPRQMERENEMIIISHRLVFLWERRATSPPCPIRGGLPFLFRPLRERASTPLGHLLPREGGRLRPPYSKAAFSHRHFERKREIFFVCGQVSTVRRGRTGNTVLHVTWEHGVSCRKLYEGKRKRETKKIPRLRSG